MGDFPKLQNFRYWHFCNVAQEQFVFISTPASPIKLLFRDAGAVDDLGPAADIAVEPL